MKPNDRFKLSTSSFVTSLYEAYVRADSGNSRRIEEAFPHFFESEPEHETSTNPVDVIADLLPDADPVAQAHARAACDEPVDRPRDLYSIASVREIAERIVRQDVIYCVSNFIHQLAQSSQAQHGLEVDYEEELLPILEVLEYDEPAERTVLDWDRSVLIDYLTDRDVATGDADDEEALRALALAELRDHHDSKQFCEEFDVEPERSDVYEHWIVSSWLAHKLEQEGHPIVRNILGMTLWGRPTTGQSISMDGVILRIANDLEKLS